MTVHRFVVIVTTILIRTLLVGRFLGTNQGATNEVILSFLVSISRLVEGGCVGFDLHGVGEVGWSLCKGGILIL